MANRNQQQNNETFIDKDALRKLHLEYERFNYTRVPGGWNKWDTFCIHKGWLKEYDYMGEKKLIAVLPWFEIAQKDKREAAKIGLYF